MGMGVCGIKWIGSNRAVSNVFEDCAVPKSTKSDRVSGPINIDEFGDLSSAIYSGASALLPASLRAPAFFLK